MCRRPPTVLKPLRSTTLKRLRKSSDVPVIILSAKDERPTVIEGFREGADDFVSKPFYIEELMERIRAVLRRGKARSLVHAPQTQELVCGGLRLLPSINFYNYVI